MLRQLRGEPEIGLSAMTATGLSNPLVLSQHWQSDKHLLDFSLWPRLRHRLTMRASEERNAPERSVGLWHEAYPVRSESIRSLYVNKPRFGFARAYGIRKS
jgi:hypothetical protein